MLEKYDMKEHSDDQMNCDLAKVHLSLAQIFRNVGEHRKSFDHYCHTTDILRRSVHQNELMAEIQTEATRGAQLLSA